MRERADEEPRKTLRLDEQSFSEFYARTSPSIFGVSFPRPWKSRCGTRPVTGSLLPLSSHGLPEMDDAGREGYLFRIATNLPGDHFRAAMRQRLPLPEAPSGADTSEKIQLRSDLEPVFLELKPRERQLLWLAYVEGRPFWRSRLPGSLLC
jgi:RNA polymerase sigma-70 factor, ECF subfamily